MPRKRLAETCAHQHHLCRCLFYVPGFMRTSPNPDCLREARTTRRTTGPLGIRLGLPSFPFEL
eukprot:scaffold5443_cov291-Pinguiococcus_pyrenoidosus.AAC.2